MTAKPPPVPSENVSPKGVGDNKRPPRDQKAKGGTSVDDPGKRGQQANTRINTTPHLSTQAR